MTDSAPESMQERVTRAIAETIHEDLVRVVRDLERASREVTKLEQEAKDLRQQWHFFRKWEHPQPTTALMQSFFTTLSPREKEMLVLCVFAEPPMRLQDMADRFGVTRERVRGLVTKALRRWRTYAMENVPASSQYTPRQLEQRRKAQAAMRASLLGFGTTGVVSPEQATALGNYLTDARERFVWNGRMCCDPPMTLDAIGRWLGISRERVRQLQYRAMRTVRLAVGRWRATGSGIEASDGARPMV